MTNLDASHLLIYSDRVVSNVLLLLTSGYPAAEWPQRAKQRVRGSEMLATEELVGGGSCLKSLHCVAGRADSLLLEDPLQRGPWVQLNFVEARVRLESFAVAVEDSFRSVDTGECP